jgi:phosphoribosyl 1,2-cyclic phosphate phosphodiesterase
LLVERADSRADLEAGQAVTRVVIDTSPDFREQMISAQVPRIDGVVFTHDHADQTHGIDDLRAFAYLQRQRIPVWMDAATEATLTSRFGYTFQAPPGSGYPPILDKRLIERPGKPVSVNGPGGSVELLALDQVHGRIRSLGFRIGDIAYSPDINELPQSSADLLQGVDCWIVDALRDEPHPTHFSVADALREVRRVDAREAVLTNLHITLDYARLAVELPEGVRPGFDGLQLEMDENGVRILA